MRTKRIKSSVRSRPRVVLVNRCFVRRKDGKFLIIRRSLEDANNAGLWEIPGGKVDKGQDLLTAREREVMEETGLYVEVVTPLVAVVHFLIGDGAYKGLPYVALFCVTRLEGGLLVLSEEHIDHAWVTFEEMLQYKLTAEVRKAAIQFKKYAGL